MKNTTNAKVSSPASLSKEVIVMTSAAIEDVWFSEVAGEFKNFGSRIDEAKANENDNVVAFLRKINSKKDPKETNAIMRSPAGLKTILSVNSPEELKGYCELFNLKADELNSLVSNSETPVSHFSNMALLTAIGIWSQNVRDSELNGESVSVEKKAISDKAFELLSGTAAFVMGRNFSKRIWTNTSQEKKRGRRSNNYMDHLFDNEKNSSK